MNLPLRFAGKYILSKKSFNFITVITTISILGIAIGVAALICVMSIFNGFREITESQIVGFDPHIRISFKTVPEENTLDSIVAQIKKINTVQSVTKVVNARAALIKGDAVQVINIKAIDPRENSYYQWLAGNMKMGKFNLASADIEPIVLGIGVADKLKAFRGDTILMLTPEMIERSLRTFSRADGKRFLVTGIFQANVKDYDYIYGFISYNAGDILINPKSSGKMIDIRTITFDNVDKVFDRIKKMQLRDASMVTWRDLNRDLYRVMQFERIATFVILLLIVIIAVFNVLASLSMTVVEKQKDISVLKAMGASDKMIRNIYLLEGTVIGLIGTFSGAVLGLLFCWGQLHFKWFAIDSSKYIINAIPVSVYFLDIVIVIVISMVLSLLATIYPSRSASKSKIVDSIRSE